MNGLWLSIQLGMSSSQLTKSYFSEGLKPPTSRCIWYLVWIVPPIDNLNWMWQWCTYPNWRVCHFHFLRVNMQAAVRGSSQLATMISVFGIHWYRFLCFSGWKRWSSLVQIAVDPMIFLWIFENKDAKRPSSAQCQLWFPIGKSLVFFPVISWIHFQAILDGAATKNQATGRHPNWPWKLAWSQNGPDIDPVFTRQNSSFSCLGMADAQPWGISSGPIKVHKSSLYYPSSRFQKCHVFSCFPSQLGSVDPSRPSNPWRPPVLHRLVPGTGERCRASPSSFPAAPASAASGTAGCRGLCPTRGEKTVVNPKHKYIYQ